MHKHFYIVLPPIQGILGESGHLLQLSGKIISLSRRRNPFYSFRAAGLYPARTFGLVPSIRSTTGTSKASASLVTVDICGSVASPRSRLLKARSDIPAR